MDVNSFLFVSRVQYPVALRRRNNFVSVLCPLVDETPSACGGVLHVRPAWALTKGCKTRMDAFGGLQQPLAKSKGVTVR